MTKLTTRNSGNKAVLSGQLVGTVRALAEHVRNGVDTPGGVKSNHPTEVAVEENGAPELAVNAVPDEAGEDEAAERGEDEIVLVLVVHDGIGEQVSAVNLLTSSHEGVSARTPEPEHVCVPEALVDVVGVCFRVHVTVVHAVLESPVDDGGLVSHGVH